MTDLHARALCLGLCFLVWGCTQTPIRVEKRTDAGSEGTPTPLAQAASSPLPSTSSNRASKTTMVGMPDAGTGQGTDARFEGNRALPLLSAHAFDVALVFSAGTARAICSGVPAGSEPLEAQEILWDASSDGTTWQIIPDLQGDTVRPGDDLAGLKLRCRKRLLTVSGTVHEGTSTPLTLSGGNAAVTHSAAVYPMFPSVQTSLTCASPSLLAADGLLVARTYAWQRNGTPWAGETAHLVDAGKASAGDLISCSVSYAGNALLPLNSRAVRVRNSLPVLAVRPTLSPATTVESTSPLLTCSLPAAVDADGETPTREVKFVRNGTVVRDWNATATYTPATPLTLADTVQCAVRARDAAGAGPEEFSPLLTIDADTNGSVIGSVPVPTAVPTAVPQQDALPLPFATTTDAPKAMGESLTCQGTTTDPEGGAVSYATAWESSADGTTFAPLAGQTSTTLLLVSSLAHKHIRCKRTASDAAANVRLSVSDALLVSNSSPQAPTIVSLTPASPTVSTTLVCGASGGVDADGDSVQIVYGWERNGVALPALTNTLVLAGYTKGDVFRCSAKNKDVFLANSATVTSGPVTILNSKPSAVTAPAISPLPLTALSANLTCTSVTASDVDVADALSYQYSLRKNGLPETAWQTSSTFTPTLVRGQAWQCGARASDGTDTGTEAWSAAVTVANSQPSLSAVTLGSSTTPARPGSVLTCTATTADADGDVPQVTFAWQGISGTATASNPSTYTVLATDVDHTISCAALLPTNADGNGSVAVASLAASATFLVDGNVTLALTGAPVLTPDCQITEAGTTTFQSGVTFSSATATWDGNAPLSNTASQTGFAAMLDTLALTGPVNLIARWVIAGTPAGNNRTLVANYTLANLTSPTPRVPGAPLSRVQQAFFSEGREIFVNGCSAGKRASLAVGTPSCLVTGAGNLKCWGQMYTPEGRATADFSPAQPLSTDLGGTTTKVSQVAASKDSNVNACALMDSGLLKCWGPNGNGQVGDGTSSPRGTPTAVLTASLNASGAKVVAVAVGTYHTCAINNSSNTGAWCWGYNLYGQGSASTGTPFFINLGFIPTGIAAGSYTNCAISAAGTVKCWGDGNVGRAGDNNGTNHSVTTPAAAIGVLDGTVGNRAVTISSGTGTTCVTTDGGKVACWGDGTSALVPTYFLGSAVDGTVGKKAVTVSASSSGLCVITDAYRVLCSGTNSSGRFMFGNTTSPPLTTATEVSTTYFDNVAGKRPVALSLGSYSMCVLTDAGRVQCAGDVQVNRAGSGRAHFSYAPLPISDAFVDGTAANAVAEIAGAYSSSAAANTANTCVRLVGGRVACWGYNGFGQLGLGDTTPRAIPTLLDTSYFDGTAGKTPLKVVSSEFTTCALLDTKVVRCWGSGTGGQLGNAVNANSNLPVLVSSSAIDGTAGKSVVDIASGAQLRLVAMDDGKAMVWGTSSNAGYLGDGSGLSTVNVPTAVSGMTGVAGNKAVKVFVSSSNTHSACILLDSGKIRCWGSSSYSIAGNGAAGATVATLVDDAGAFDGTAGKKVIDIAIGLSHRCALREDNRVFCWGSDSGGALGNGAGSTNQAAPLEVDTTALTGAVGDKAVSIGAHTYMTCVALDSGQLKCWGTNTNQMLSTTVASNANVESPILVRPEIFDGTVGRKVVKVQFPANDTLCVLVDAGKTYCWGYNSQYNVSGAKGANIYQPATGQTYVSLPEDVLDVGALPSSGTNISDVARAALLQLTRTSP